MCLKGIVFVWSPRIDVHPWGPSGGMLLCLDIQVRRQMNWLIADVDSWRDTHQSKEYIFGSGLKLHSMLDVDWFRWKKMTLLSQASLVLNPYVAFADWCGTRWLRRTCRREYAVVWIFCVSCGEMTSTRQIKIIINKNSKLYSFIQFQ